MKRTWMACALLLLCANARATTLRPVDASDLIDQAELIFTGVAVDRQVATSKDGRYPYTFVTFAVDDVLKGHLEGEELTLRFEGGEIGEELVEVLGMPEFERNGNYLLFVADNGHAISPVVGWGQGTFELLEHPSRSGAKVVVDRNGMVVEGVVGGLFLRTRAEREGRSVRRSTEAPTGVVVLEEDGVTITDPLAPNLAKADVELMPADLVLQSLRATLAKRMRSKSFRPGVLVRSLTIDDVPDQFTLRPTTTERR